MTHKFGQKVIFIYMLVMILTLVSPVHSQDSDSNGSIGISTGTNTENQLQTFGGEETTSKSRNFWEPTPKETTSVYFDVKHSMVSSKVDSTDAELSKMSFTTGYSGKHVDFSYTYQKFDWTDIYLLTTGNGRDIPWETLHDLSISAHEIGPIKRNLFYFVDVLGGFAFEKQFDASFYGRLSSGVVYAFEPEVQVQTGLTLEHFWIETKFYPYFQLHIKRKHSNVTYTLGYPVTEVDYKFNRDISLKGCFTIERKVYRLADGNIVQDMGYLKARRYLGTLTMNYKLSNSIMLGCTAEYGFKRKYEIFEKFNERIVSSMDVDDEFLGSLNFNYIF